MEDYRTKVFKLLPNLKYLDDADADDNDEAEEESEDGEANGAEEEDDDDDDEEEDDEDGEEESSDDDAGELTLSDLYKKNLDDDEDGEDFVEDGEEEDDDDDDIDDEDDQPSSKKAKVGNGGENADWDSFQFSDTRFLLAFCAAAAAAARLSLVAVNHQFHNSLILPISAAKQKPNKERSPEINIFQKCTKHTPPTQQNWKRKKLSIMFFFRGESQYTEAKLAFNITKS